MALKTRMLKAECMACGYVARVTRTHLERVGPPICPCNSQPMRSDEWADYQRIQWQEFEQMASDAESGRTRVIRSQWVESLRRAQECSRCLAQLPIGESAHLDVYTVGGEFFSEYTCWACHPETRSQYANGANACLGGR